MRIMQEGGLPFLVGGAYAFAKFTGIERHTKDFDVFIRRQDWPLAEHIFNRAGYETELAFPHWIGKAFQGDEFVDLIYSAETALHPLTTSGSSTPCRAACSAWTSSSFLPRR